jgi:DNA-binding NtrC family response regulator
MSGHTGKGKTGTNQPERNATILLLGSEPIAQSAVRDSLEDAGYLVQAATNLGTAVTMLTDCPVDLLITHPYIAEIPGHEAAKYLRTKHPGMAVLMVAGLLEDDRIRNSADLERYEIFPQPFTAAQLIEKVRQVLKTVSSS